MSPLQHTVALERGQRSGMGEENSVTGGRDGVSEEFRGVQVAYRYRCWIAAP